VPRGSISGAVQTRVHCLARAGCACDYARRPIAPDTDTP
jgi:hypothetical protein